MPVRRLIVNADDFGLTDGINRAVRDLHQLDALESTTLMAAAPRFHEAVEISRQQMLLGVGCHIVLVDGNPVANPSAIPTLLEPARSTSSEPRFRSTLGEFVRDLYLGRIDSTHIEQEATAQILRLQQAGVAVTHIDTHKHTHMFPRVLDSVTRAAQACNIRAIRNPFEPAWSVAATPGAAGAQHLDASGFDALTSVHVARRAAVRRTGTVRFPFGRAGSRVGISPSPTSAGRVRPAAQELP